MLTKMTKTWKKYILWFAQEHVDFRNAEIESIVKMLNLEMRKICDTSEKPFWIVEFPNNETAERLASRAISLRHIFELWAHSKTITSFHGDILAYIHVREPEVQQYFNANTSFKITVETYNKHFSQEEKIEKIESFNYLSLKGRVNLRTPDVEWWYIEFWGLDPKTVPTVPEDLLFGRLLYSGQRHLIKELSLKQRKFIGNTSMDAQLSLLMANQALVCDGDLVFDPFVGTGSLLVSAAKFGGYVLGSDIDFMMIHARSRPSRISQKVRAKDESIRANLRQYGYEHRYLDVLVSDFSNPLWRQGLKFDCIITDPPYGIREATEKVENKVNTKASTRSDDVPHYPSTSHYSLQELYGDLLKFAAKYLKLGGRLVCWLPFHRQDYTEHMVPRHINLKLVANSEQPLTGLTSRRLLTYEKHSEPSEDLNQQDLIVDYSLHAEFRERYFDNGLESRSERRHRRAEQRERGRQEALKRGKMSPEDSKTIKCNLNKARFI